MKKHFKILILILLVCTAFFSAAGCASPNKKNSGGKLNIVATIFPAYDFARQIAGDKANVKMLLPAGVETHTFDPTPQDIIMINNCDIFIYIGEEMEPWVSSISENLEDGITLLDLSKGVEYSAEHENERDPHIWTSPVIAKIMAANIRDTLLEADSGNKDFYENSSGAYLLELDKLDAEIRAVTNASSHAKIFFGGRFALHYFVTEYNISYASPYRSCDSEAEPGAAAIADIIDEMKAEKAKVIYYEELTNPSVAAIISEDTGAEMLLFHSCHNVSQKEFDDGVSYLSLMRQNAENLKKGLL